MLRRSHLRPLVAVCTVVAATALGAAPASAGNGFGDRPLKVGSHGKDVKRLQSILTELGFKTSVDGQFGPATRKSVRRYERSRKQSANGVVSRGQAREMKKRARHADRGKGKKSGAGKKDGKGGKKGGGSRRFGERTLKIGARGDDVRKLQHLLTKLGFKTGIDGDFGPATQKSLKRYERSRKMATDGVVSKGQAERMRRAADKVPKGGVKKKPKRHLWGSRKLREGKQGRDVRELQRVLGKLGIPTGVDGRFGPATAKSVRRYERWQKAKIDARVPVPQAREMKRKAARGARRPRKERSGGGHAFPVRGPYSFGSSGSRFGAPRGGRSHQGQDISAAQGTPIVAVHRGRVSTRAYQASGAGNYVVIRGKDGSDSVYMHMRDPAIVGNGEKVSAGERIGYVGNTGASFGAHLHFELWTPHWFAGGHPYDPLPKLQDWAR